MPFRTKTWAGAVQARSTPNRCSEATQHTALMAEGCRFTRRCGRLYSERQGSLVAALHSHTPYLHTVCGRIVTNGHASLGLFYMLNRRCSRSQVSPPWRRLPAAAGVPAHVTGAAAAIGAARPAAASSKAAAALRRQAPASSRTGAVLAAVATGRRPVGRRRFAAAHAPVVQLQRLPAAALQHRAWRTSTHDCGSAAWRQAWEETMCVTLGKARRNACEP